MIHLLITDIDMTWMSGTDLVGQLLRERPRIKVILMTKSVGGKNLTHPVLVKPFTAAMLKEKVSEVLAAA